MRRWRPDALWRPTVTVVWVLRGLARSRTGTPPARGDQRKEARLGSDRVAAGDRTTLPPENPEECYRRHAPTLCSNVGCLASDTAHHGMLRRESMKSALS